MTFLRWAGLSLIWLAGIATIIGSSIKEERPLAAPPVPVDVRFDLTSGNLRRALATRTAVLSDLLLTGIYSDANQGDQLTLNRNSIVLDSDSGFTISITESDDELIGQSEIDIGAALDIGLAHNPVAGQFSSMFSVTETTTIVTVTADGLDVLTGAATTATPYSWANFKAAENDANASLNLRMASAAYNMFEVVLRAARLAEDIVADIETDANKSALEAMGTNTRLRLNCDNSMTDGDASQSLYWRTDRTGQGVIGDGDSFEARFNNCQDASRGHYLDGNVDLSQYNPADNDGLSTFGVTTELSTLYFSDTAIDDDTITPTATSPRFNGAFSLSYRELAL